MRNNEVITYVEANLPEDLKSLNVMQKRKFIKTVIDLYIKFIHDTLIERIPFTIRNIGKLIPSTRNIGAGVNPFTGLPRKAKLINIIKFRSSKNLKEEIRNEI